MHGVKGCVPQADGSRSQVVTMKGLCYAALALSLVTILGGCGSKSAESPGVSPAQPTNEHELNSAQPLKGHEIYSWQVDGDWHFALLAGTNRIKTLDEVTSPDVSVEGTEALRGKLNRLSNGERVFWSARRVRGLAMPPDDIISEIGAYCAQLGILLEIDL